MEDPFGIDDPRGESVPTRQDGNLFVPDGSALPPFCVSCGKPARKYSKQTFGAFPQFGQLWLIFLGHVVFRRTSLGVPLCSEHLSRHRKLTAGSVLLCLMILPVTFGVMLQFDLIAGLIVGLVAIAIATVMISRARVLRLKRIGEYEYIFTGAAEDFLTLVKMREPRNPVKPL